jgi:Uma2 family endonuclease
MNDAFEIFGPNGVWSSPEDYCEYVRRLTTTRRVEIIDGKAVDWPERSVRDGALAFAASFHIHAYLQDHPRGQTFRPSPGFILRTRPRRLIRVPDVAYIELHRVAEIKFIVACPVPPDLIVEILTDGGRRNEVETRVHDFLQAGTTMAWILDGCAKTCEIRRRTGESRTFGFNDKVYAAPLLARLNLRVYELFGE